MPDLTTLQAVRAYLQMEANVTTHDDLLTSLITRASDHFVAGVGRQIVTAAVTETLDGDDTDTLLLAHYPVTAITSVTVGGVLQVPRPDSVSSGYVLADPAIGKLKIVGSLFTKGVQNVVIVYSAGYGATAPTEVEQAVIDQVAYWFKGKDRIGIGNQTIGGESVSYLGAWTAQQGSGGNTPLFEATVARYRP